MKVSDVWKDAPKSISDRELGVDNSLIKKVCVSGVWSYENKTYNKPDRKSYAKGKYGEIEYEDDCVRLARLTGEFLTYSDTTTAVRIRIK